VQEAERIEDCQVNLRGDPHALGEKSPRGFVPVLFPENAALPKIAPEESGRLELARWITRRDNPLTARVMANRVWYHLFGRGIVDTTDNFGNSGAKPTHPQLLDYLAVRFMDQGWSMKKLVREVVLSHAYRLSTAYSARNFAVEPDNRLLWRQNRRRLEAEAIRDSLLAISGKLDLTPPAGSPIAEVPRDNDLSRIPRVQVVRNNVSRFFETFDFPEPSETRGVRDVTTVAPQALYLMNDPFVAAQARAAAEKAISAEPSVPERVRLAYRQTLGREPTTAELERALSYVNTVVEGASGDDATSTAEPDAWARFYQVLFASAEFRYH
jgi:hypothetical protein